MLPVMKVRSVLLLLGLSALVLPVSCRKQTENEAERILRRQTVRFSQPPERIPSPCSVDAPLMGDGFTGVAISGPPERQVFHIARNDFWRLKSAHDESYPAVLGLLSLTVPAMEGASYQVEQQLYDATTTARFEKGRQALSYEAYVAATEDILVITISNEGAGALEGSVSLELYPGRDFPEKRDSGITCAGIRNILREFTGDVEIPSKAAAAMRIDGSGDGSFSLKPGRKLIVVCAFSSNFKSEDCLRAAVDKASSCGKAFLARARKEHGRWWKEYWERSYVSIPDPDIERQYYLSLYGMASCSRDPDFPPPLFGTWITKEPPSWMGDYHLNYNHMAPYYALYSANRIEQAEPYYAPLLAAIPRGEYYSEAVTGIPEGILLPVGIGPLGIETTRWSDAMEKKHKDWRESGNIEEGGMFWGQKSNSAYAVANLAMQFHHTWDKKFCRKVYPFVKGVATFWENYLTLEGERYVIYNDAIHEGTVGTMNPILSLGMVRLVMDTACEMSDYLGVDKDRRDAWRDRRDRLSDYPLQERDGRTVFRYTEKGVDWWRDNTLGIQHIYPAGQVGLSSDPWLLEVAWNTVDVMRRWLDFNGTNSFFPAAVRSGYPADSILLHLHEYSLHTYPNGFQYGNPHGTENWSTVPNTINEMLCMGHQGLVRLFPVWPRNLDASFHQIRVEGAFLVSSSIKDGITGDVTLVSEQGRELVMENPWPDQEVEVKAPGGKRLSFKEDMIKMPTVPGGRYVISRRR